MTGAEIAIGLGLYWLAKGGKPGGGKETEAARVDDGVKLIARAMQPGAARWVPIFVLQDAPQGLAEALARWAGIESSGNPLAVSKYGERGLLQITHTTVKEGALTEAEWAALASPATTNEEHARIAMKEANWLWLRAKRYVANPPADFISGAWYAKLYHQRPVDVRDGKLHGPALLMARELQDRWKSDKKKMHRLRAANVVAFGRAEL